MDLTAEGTADLSTDRIQQLNEIDNDVVKLLESAGSTIRALTISDDTSENGHDQSSIITRKKESFTAAMSQYFALLASIDVGLRRQISALEDAEIIPSETAYKESQASQIGLTIAGQKQASKGAVTGGGLGSLDVGWLNSRNDRVGKEKEAELWDSAVAFLQSDKQMKGTTEMHLINGLNSPSQKNGAKSVDNS